VAQSHLLRALVSVKLIYPFRLRLKSVKLNVVSCHLNFLIVWLLFCVAALLSPGRAGGMADPTNPLPSSATSVSFSFLTSEDIRRISVKQIVNPQLFDHLNRPDAGGLYDPALGPSGRGDM
jgi:hypothetical protein